MDERDLRDRANELHQFFLDAEDRERAAEKRHKELIEAIGKLTTAFDRGLRDLTDTIRQQSR